MIKYSEALEKHLETIRKTVELSGCIRTTSLDVALEIAELVLNENADITCRVTIELDPTTRSGHGGPSWMVYWEEI